MGGRRPPKVSPVPLGGAHVFLGQFCPVVWISEEPGEQWAERAEMFSVDARDGVHPLTREHLGDAGEWADLVHGPVDHAFQVGAGMIVLDALGARGLLGLRAHHADGHLHDDEEDVPLVVEPNQPRSSVNTPLQDRHHDGNPRA